MQTLPLVAYVEPRMSTWAILGTGQSLKVEDIEYLRGKCSVIAVSDSYKLAPWADVLVSHDSKWWRHHPQAFEFAGQKYCRHAGVRAAAQFKVKDMGNGCNSGFMAMCVAKHLGATRILLLGIDMYGTHFFGPHPEGLNNTNASRFKIHIEQFSRFSGAEVVNCNPNSALKRFPFANLREVI